MAEEFTLIVNDEIIFQIGVAFEKRAKDNAIHKEAWNQLNYKKRQKKRNVFNHVYYNLFFLF